MTQSYNNRSLFSDYYLEERAPEDAHWQALKKVAREHRQRIVNTLEKALPGIDGDTPEAEVERRLIRPMLDTLGHTYFVQPAVPSPEGVRRPDYAFFSSSDDRQKAESYKGQAEFFRETLAVGDAKAWERSLDKRVKGPGDPFTNHNPSYQIDFYLRATDKRWGLLTNGRHWRLYQRDLSYRLDVYYEVDLPEILTHDEDAFLYFLAFFHKYAFQPDGNGECFLDRAYRNSTEYAATVSEELQDNVYEALRLLAEGFLSFPENGLSAQDLDIIRENAFIVIYRLLFIMYAEAREFLPVTKPTYWGTYSLRALSHAIAAKEPFEANLHPTTTTYWSRLGDLFRLINKGDSFLGIPPYNGRLFDDQKEHQKLATWKIGDRYLAAAIDQLARARAAGRTGRGFVSYRDLSTRELGSIYEGLLEHRPQYAAQDMAVVKEGKRERFVPVSKLGNRRPFKTYPAGSVYLETDRGERKATGSYYTPDYIVKYIVSNTLGPLIDEAKNSGGNVIDSILSLKVLDPAMGSAHFLVEATDYLARALVEALGVDPREMEEDEVRWARREVVERCIYGVDLNPLAVDLAKLSLWLSTVSLDKPLNFLDHHLRCGNSLIGARLDDLGILPEMTKKNKQKPVTTLAGHQFKGAIAAAVSTFQQIAQAPSDSVEDIHRKESAYETARHALSQIKTIAEVWTSTSFGNEVRDKDAYERLLHLAESDSANWPKANELPWLDKAKAMSQERNFFHWELEFPDVYFDRNGQGLPNPGFQASVGNPPWGGALDRTILGFLDAMYEDVNDYESYQYFSQTSVQNLADGGKHSFIVPNTYVLNVLANPLRRWMFDKGAFNLLVDCSDVQLFDDPSVRCIIYVYTKGITNNGIVIHKLATTLDNSMTVNNWCLVKRSEIADGRPWAYLLRDARNVPDLVSRIEKVSIPLGTISKSKQGYIPYRLTTLARRFGEKEAKRIKNSRAWHSRSKLDVTYLPELQGGDVSRFEIDWSGVWVSYGEWVSSYVELEYFTTPRLLFREITSEPPNRLLATYVAETFVHNPSVLNACFLQTEYSHLYCLTLVNSSLLSEYFYRTSSKSDKGLFPKVLVEDVRRLPIRRMNFTMPRVEREQLMAEAKRLFRQYLQSKDWNSILLFVAERLPHKLDGTPDTELEQSDVIHDLLAFLAEKMIRLHKDKQAEIEGFLIWLKSYLAINIEDLKNKTRVKEYYKAEVAWEGLLNALEQNRRTIQLAKGIDITRREPREVIRSEFDTSIAKLTPILEVIELTDKLIGQVVYRLYGLTEEEIAVVERQPIQIS